MERSGEEAQISESKPMAAHLQCRNVVAAGQLRMDGFSALNTGMDGLGGISGRVVGHAVDPGGTAAIRRAGRGGSRDVGDIDWLIAAGGGGGRGGC